MEFNPQKLSVDAYTLLALVSIGVSGGFLFLLIYFPHYFVTIDSFRLSISAIGISAPVMLWNFMWYGTLHSKTEKKLDNNFVMRVVAVGLTLSIFVLYSSILAGFYFNLSKKIGVGIIIIWEVLYFFYIGYKYVKTPEENP
jgi:hypothetical protein